MSRHIEVRFFGPFEMFVAGRILPRPATLKSQSLLAYLILHRKTPQRRNILCNLFWGDRLEDKARGSLSTALWHIHRCLPAEELILRDGDTIQFNPKADIWLDVENFVSRVSAPDPDLLSSAIALYRGDFLDGFYDDWIVEERYRLESLYCSALARVMAGQETEGSYQAALATAQHLLAYDPLQEDAHRLVMRADCQLGQRNAALAQYKQCRDILQRELGVEPTLETRTLYQAILEGSFETSSASQPLFREISSPATLVSSGRSPLEAALSVHLVGRKAELAFLQQCWRSAKAGIGGTVLLHGEAGIGKTRLVDEFATPLRRQGIRVLKGGCYEFERLLPYQPIAEALRAILPTLSRKELSSCPSWALQAVSQLVPEIITGEMPMGSSDSPAPDQARLFEGIVQLLFTLSKSDAILIILEDLHWASESTLQLLHYLVRRLKERPLLLVGTYRTEAANPSGALGKLQAELLQNHTAQVLSLPRLSVENLEAMLSEMSGSSDASRPLAQRLYQETKGNPFFFVETIRGLFEKRFIQLEQGRWHVDFTRIGEKGLPLPESLGKAIEARVQSLSRNAREALQVAAVLGHEFDLELLKEVWDRGDEATLEALDDLLRQRLLEEGSGPASRDYVFVHHKIREIVYSGIPRHLREHIHTRAAMALETLHPAQKELFAGEIAYHYEQYPGPGQSSARKAVAYLLQAGDRARFLYAYQEALDYYQRALVILKSTEQHEQAAQTLMKIALTHHTALDFEHSGHAYEEGLALWQGSVKAQTEKLPPAPHALRVGWREPETLDPMVSNLEWSGRVIDQLFSGLTGLTAELDIVPDVAYSWDVLDAGRRYIFHLRHDVCWSDGKPVTAGDFEYAWKRALEPKYESPFTELLEDIRGAKSFRQGKSGEGQVAIFAVDEFTLQVDLDEPNGYFLYLIPYLVPIPRHVVEEYGPHWCEPQHIVTNGPFLLDAWLPGRSIQLLRNPHYHGHFPGNLQRVELCLDPSIPAQLALYEAGELDFFDAWTLPLQERDRALQRNAADLVSLPEISTIFLAFDVSRPPFDNVCLRRAFAMAIDRGRLANVVLRGCIPPATGGMIPPGFSAHSPGIGLPFDVERARRLLAEARYSVELCKAVNAIATTGFFVPYANFLQTQWKEHLGIDLSWQIVAHGFFADRIREAPPNLLLLGLMPECPDPGVLLRTSQISQYTHWMNNTYAELVTQAKRTRDQAERMQLYREADRVLAEEAAIVPLTYSRTLLLVKPWVKNYSISPLTRWLWKDVVIEPH